MKVKALVLGALPGPFEGPWVNLDDGQEWEVECPDGLNGECMLHVESKGQAHLPPARLPLVNGHVIKNVSRARIVVLEDIRGIDLLCVSVKCVR